MGKARNDFRVPFDGSEGERYAAEQAPETYGELRDEIERGHARQRFVNRRGKSWPERIGPGELTGSALWQAAGSRRRPLAAGTAPTGWNGAFAPQMSALRWRT